MSKQLNILNDYFAVDALPPGVTSVEAVRGAKGYFNLIFVTSSGKFILAKKTEAHKPYEFRSLDTLQSRLNRLGWGSDLIVRGLGL